ncbi:MULTISPECIES: hypothetical protein [unclassified Streptomyces]|uniref:hypothetical protein n=1 Tax=unclassified Streptomyces TaxID=2593676 RepID=UPI00109EB2A0|nr:hypothetical protein [Streptomyces sp. A1136]THA46204.1 hypothetical protein E6R62_34525 [Streptomyces sp. A1136]
MPGSGTSDDSRSHESPLEQVTGENDVTPQEERGGPPPAAGPSRSSERVGDGAKESSGEGEEE